MKIFLIVFLLRNRNMCFIVRCAYDKRKVSALVTVSVATVFLISQGPTKHRIINIRRSEISPEE